MSQFKKELQSIERELVDLGWRIEDKKSGRFAYAPDGKNMVSWHRGQNDPRSVKNLIAFIRKADPRFRPR